MSSEPTTVILGLGNTILSDDGIGVYTARRARELVDLDEEISIKEAELAGFALIDLLEGYDRAVIIDAVHLPGKSPGHVEQIEMERFKPTARLSAGHQIDLPTAVELGRQLGYRVPDEIFVVGIQVEDDRTVSEACTLPVLRAIEPAARLAVELARRRIRNTVSS